MAKALVAGALSVLVLSVAACGGGSSSTNASATTTKPSVAASTTTTTFVAPAADVALAKEAAISMADYGSQWTQYKASAGAGGGGNETGCGIARGGPVSKVGRGAVFGGPQAKFTSSDSYAISTATVFPDEATAKAWAAIRRSAEYKKCSARSFDAGAKSQDPKAAVVVLDVKDPSAGSGGYEDFTRYEAQAPDKTGKLVPFAYYDSALYRSGRVVIATRLEHESSLDQDGQQKLNESFVAALNKAYQRVA